MEYYRRYEPLFGAWYINRFIGQGASGEVFEINCKAPDGKVYSSALKAVSIPQSSDEIRQLRMEGLDDGAIREYFDGVARGIERECSYMMRFNGHPNIIGYDDHIAVRRENGIGWDILIKMPLLVPFTEYYARCSFSEADVIKFGIHMCCALEECHGANIIHRDLKPENIFYDGIGNFKLGDFGIARELDKTRTGLTKTGTLIYMAPEIYSGEPYGKSVDTYSLGLVLYQLLNHNRIPFLPLHPAPVRYSDKERAFEIRMTGARIPYPDGTDDRELCDIVLRACAFDHSGRFGSASEMKAALIAAAAKYGISADDPESIAITPTQPVIFNTMDVGDGREAKGRRQHSSPAPKKEKKPHTYISPAVRNGGKASRISTKTAAIAAVLLIMALTVTAVIIFAAVKSGAGDDERDLTDNLSRSEWPISIGAELTEDGTLRLSGSGKLPDYTKSDTENGKNPFYGKGIRNIIIDKGISHIGDRCFLDGSMIVSCDFGSVRSIGEYAFLRCTSLRRADLSGVVEIDKNAFIECTGLERVDISSVRSIGDSAFMDCDSLESVDIPASAENVSSTAFAGCDKLKGINVDEKNISYRSINGVMYSKNGTSLLCFPAGRHDAGYHVADSVTSIGVAAFYDTKVQSIILPESCSAISSLAFANSEALVYVTITAKDVTIAEDAFQNCTNLTLNGYAGSSVQTYASAHKIRFEPIG